MEDSKVPVRHLIIAPHADDAEYGMGGYISRMLRNGLAIPSVRIVAGGDYVDRHGKKVSGEERMAETTQAMRALGVTDFSTIGSPNENEFDIAGRACLSVVVDALLSERLYTNVYVCLPSFNQDHTALFDAVMVAFRPGRQSHIKQLWAYEYPGNCWGPQPPATGFAYVALTQADIGKKVQALSCHKSQNVTNIQQPFSTQGMINLATQRGSEIGLPYAEKLYLLREII